MFDDGRFAFVVGGIVLEGVFADQVIEARSAGFAHRRQLVVGVGGHGVVHDAVFFQAGQCLVVLLARELVVIDVLGILLEAQIQVDDYDDARWSLNTIMTIDLFFLTFFFSSSLAIDVFTTVY